MRKRRTAVSLRRDSADAASLTIGEIFSSSGPLAATLDGFESRAEQVEVAEAVERAFRSRGVCIAEAGTGVGKTFAYLVPAVRAALRGETTVISTHTIGLQTQLVERDIPALLGSLTGTADLGVALMKGRGNYLCLQELANARGDILLYDDPAFRKVEAWSRDPACDGDRASLPFRFAAWGEVSARFETCPGVECRHYQDCHYFRMRRAAEGCRLIVVNHALLMADLAIRDGDTFTGVIPPFQHLVIDEAHRLEETATGAFGRAFELAKLASLLDRVQRSTVNGVDRQSTQALKDAALSIFNPFRTSGRPEVVFGTEVDEAATRQVAAAGVVLENGLSELSARLTDAGGDASSRERLTSLKQQLDRMREDLVTCTTGTTDESVAWAELPAARTESGMNRATLHRVPVSIEADFRARLWEPMHENGAVVLTSATLSDSSGFGFLRARLAVPEDAEELLVGSPFDFRSQALLYVPQEMATPPRAFEADWCDSACEVIERVVGLTGGRAFLLFTSRRMLDAAYERLESRLPFKLFKQGDMPVERLLRAFRASGDGCLFGVQTFWEGVDVRGTALSAVVIDRLPFAVPDSPLNAARVQRIVREGGDWFTDYALPHAQMRLKQGFGRLIRTRSDRGIVCVLDTRLLTAPYGPSVVDYLPRATRASTWARVERFWREADADPDLPAPNQAGSGDQHGDPLTR